MPCTQAQQNKSNQGTAFTACNFSGIHCEGIWILKREVKEKTAEGKQKNVLIKQLQKDSARNRHYNEYYLAQKEFDRLKSMWDFEK